MVWASWASFGFEKTAVALDDEKSLNKLNQQIELEVNLYVSTCDAVPAEVLKTLYDGALLLQELRPQHLIT